MGFTLIPVLACLKCQALIALPYRRVREKSAGQHYWPMDSATLAIVCHRCAHLCRYLESDVRREDADTLALDSSTSFWRVQIGCAHENCGLLIEAHMRFAEDCSPSELASAIAKSSPTPSCPNGHAVSSKCRAWKIDRIEWTGRDEFLM